MSKVKAPKAYPQVKAFIYQVRLEEESLQTPSYFSNSGKTAKTHTRTTSTFEVGLPDGESPPKSFQISLNYSVKLADNDTSDAYATYTSKTTAIFEIMNEQELKQLQEAPVEIWEVYFSFVHLLARRSATERIASAGFLGVILPVPDNIKATVSDGPATEPMLKKR